MRTSKLTLRTLGSTFIAIFLISPSALLAQNKNTVASDCKLAVEANEIETARELASEISTWINLFGTNVIANAEFCLNATQDDFWKYSKISGRFLSGEEARSEQAFINGADERKLSRESELARLECGVRIAQLDLNALEVEDQQTQKLRRLETFLSTSNICSTLYREDQSTTLINPVCNNLFSEIGLPDSQFEFDQGLLFDARSKLLAAQLRLIEIQATSRQKAASSQTEIDECRELLARN